MKTKIIRNDLMHPKQAVNLMIGDPEFRTIEQAFEWFNDELLRLNQVLKKVKTSELIEDLDKL